jgi:energy-coupling factor transport system ATP-binding protein
MGLIAQGVSYEYAAGTGYAVAALNDVSLTLRPGELVLLVGGTGSGKSTFLRVCAGLLEPSSGAVTVDGAAVTDPPVRRRVGLVFQNPEGQLFAESVLADVAFGPRNLGMDDPDGTAKLALAAVGISAEEYGDRSPFTLSGGEARRVAIAGVLAMHPAYLLLDEPTAGLDASGRAAVLAAVRAVREDAGVLIVTHDAEEFLGDADRVVALDDGHVRYAGTPAELLADPERYETAGQRVPEVVRAQMLAVRRGAAVGPFTMEPSAAADALVAARGLTG